MVETSNEVKVYATVSSMNGTKEEEKQNQRVEIVVLPAIKREI